MSWDRKFKKRNRNKSQKLNGFLYLQGHPIESENCRAPLCRQEGETNSSIGLDDIRPAKENLTSECMCGCSMELGEGTFSLVVSSALCNSSYIAWTFTVNATYEYIYRYIYAEVDWRWFSNLFTAFNRHLVTVTSTWDWITYGWIAESTIGWRFVTGRLSIPLWSR